MKLFNLLKNLFGKKQNKKIKYVEVKKYPDAKEEDWMRVFGKLPNDWPNNPSIWIALEDKNPGN